MFDLQENAPLNARQESRYAAIDIGTNTALLLIVQVDQQGNMIELVQEQRFPRLGRELAGSGRIGDSSAAKALEAIEEYVGIAGEYQVQMIKIVGTAALREAENGPSFCQAVRKSTGIPVDIISGDEEACLSFMGVLSNKPYLRKKILVVDIGGGSSEFIWGKDRLYEGGVSLGIGSVKLTELFKLEDRVDLARIEEAGKYIADHLDETKQRIVTGHDHFVGTAGTYTTLAAIQMGMSNYDPARIDGMALSRDQISEILDRLKDLDSLQRLEIPGIAKGREDVILGGAIMAGEFVKWFGLSRIIISDRGLRYGVILTALKEDKSGDLS